MDSFQSIFFLGAQAQIFYPGDSDYHRIGRRALHNSTSWEVRKGFEQRDYLTFGPFVRARAGRYRVTFTLGIDDNYCDNRHILHLDIVDSPDPSGVRAYREVYRRDFYYDRFDATDFSLDFYHDGKKPLEFRVYYLDSASVVHYSTELQRL